MIESRHTVRPYLPWTVAVGQMDLWRWVAARASGFGKPSLSVLFPVVVVGLMFGAACGAPDEVVRHAGPAGATGGGSGGGISGTGGEGAGGVAGSTAEPSGGSLSQGGFGNSGGSVGSGGKSSTGGTVSSGGKVVTGGTSATGGKVVTGGTTATGGGGARSGGTGAGGAGAGGTTGTGGISPFPSGGSSKGGAGGTRTGGVSAGGNGAGGATTGGSSGGGRGGTSGSGGATSTVATGALQVWVAGIAGSTNGQISLNLRIDNTTSANVDLSTVTLRYWYQDEGWNTSTLTLEVDYKSVSGDNVTGGKAVAASPATAGADHYLELSFSGTIAARGQFATNLRLHNTTWQGTVDVTNDYSYNGTAVGYDDKITLYQSGKLIWGKEP
jgi:hypothetical protein